MGERKKVEEKPQKAEEWEKDPVQSQPVEKVKEMQANVQSVVNEDNLKKLPLPKYYFKASISCKILLKNLIVIC